MTPVPQRANVTQSWNAAQLFLFDLPRLSVDIDLNYVGAADRQTMLGKRPQLERAIITDVFPTE